MQFLTDPNPGFGPLSWVFFIAQIVLLLVGGYFAFVRRDTNAVRGQALQRLGFALLALGAAGTLVGVLRLSVVPPFTSRLWFFLVGVFELVAAIVAFTYSQRVYPQQVAAMESSKGMARRVQPMGRGGTMPASARTTAPVARKATGNARHVPQPVEVGAERPSPAPSARRDARRDRKRKRK